MTSVARGMFNGPDIDPEAFQRLIVTARSIAISRPENLVQYANTEYANQYAGIECGIYFYFFLNDVIIIITCIIFAIWKLWILLYIRSLACYTFLILATITSAPTDSDTPYVQTSSGAAQAYSFIRLTEAEQLHFTTHLVQTFWRLHANRPSNVQIAPACLPGNDNAAVTIHHPYKIVINFVH